MGKYFKVVTKSSTDEEVERRVLFCRGDSGTAISRIHYECKYKYYYMIPLTGTHQRDALPYVIREVNDAVSRERSSNI